MRYAKDNIINICNSKSWVSAKTEMRKIARPLRMHAYGEKIEDLLKERFPSEPDNIYKYRKNNLPHISQIFFSRVSNVISRIRQAKDFSVTGWNKDGHYDGFEKFCTEDFPLGGGNFIDWVFGNVVKEMLVEPNGLLFIGYEAWFDNSYAEFETEPYEANTPTARLFKFEDVVYYKKNKALVLKRFDGDRLIILPNENGEGYSLFIANNAGTLLDITPSFGLLYFPCMLLGGNLKNCGEGEIYESFIQAAMEPLNKVIQYTSEEDLMIKEALHPTLIVIGGEACPECLGDGYHGDRIEENKCRKCKGTGEYVTKGSAALRIIKPPKNGQSLGYEMPGAWYLQMDTSTLTAMSASVEKYWSLAYSSICFEFLTTSTSAAQAGVAKAYDKQEVNAFLYKISTHVINSLIKPSLKLLAFYFYEGRYPHASESDILPTVSVPENFDILMPGYIESELLNLRNAHVDQSLIVSAMMDVIDYKYANEPLTRQMNKDALLINPMAGVLAEEKDSAVLRGAYSRFDDYLSCNIYSIIVDLYENVEFAALSFEQRKNKIIATAEKNFPSKVNDAIIRDSAANNFSQEFPDNYIS